VYIISEPEPPDVPSRIRVQIIWESKNYEKHVSLIRTLVSTGNYNHVLAEIKAICTYAFQDSQELGDSPYYDLLYGVNYLDNV